MSTKEIILRYGCNPHQKPARIFTENYPLPVTVLNGSPGYINFCDALNSWQLVKEMRDVLHLPAAASFKHVSPAGAAVGIPLDDTLKKSLFIEDLELSPLAAAYARARGADRISSYGDWIALSEVVDTAAAQLIKREISDGIIAPGYETEALEILKQKKQKKYVILQIDPDYTPPQLEKREIFGVTLEQKRNDIIPDFDCLNNVVTKNKEIPAAAKRDLVIAQICLKYTQSNSVCFSYNGQVIGIGAGQQSRIHCTRLAGTKADRWFLQQHPAVLGLKFKKNINRTEKNNIIDLYLENTLSSAEETFFRKAFEKVPQRLTLQEKMDYLKTLKNICIASDGFFPFRDNIDRAKQSGVMYVVQPGGSIRDDVVIEACNEYNMVMAFSQLRLFHH